MLIFLVATLRLWILVNTEVCARDSVGFVRYALTFEQKTWSDALLSEYQHPGYPVVMYAVSKPLRALWGTTPDVMFLAAQIVSAAASIGLASMMFLLGRMLWDRFIGFFGALLFQVLPTSGHNLSDGISDGMFLFFAMASLYQLIRARETPAAWRHAAAGACIGLAYLTRPEGLLILAAAWLFALRAPFVRGTQTTWRKTGLGLAGVTVACVLIGSPYYFATGQITRKPSARKMIAAESPTVTAAGPAQAGAPLFASLFGAFAAPAAGAADQLYRTVRAIFSEFGVASHHGGIILLLAGLVLGGRRLTRHEGIALLVLYGLAHFIVLVRLGYTVSYVSERHVMILVATTCFPCVLGAERLAALFLSRGKIGLVALREGAGGPRTRVATGLLMALVFAVCLTKTLQPLHGNRAGNHAAGLWLASVLMPGDIIEDEYSWSQYYAGQFTGGDPPALSADAAPTKYVVITRRRDGTIDSAEKTLSEAGSKAVYHWPTKDALERARVVVYALPRDFTREPWAKAASATSIRAVSRPVDH